MKYVPSASLWIVYSVQHRNTHKIYCSVLFHTALVSCWTQNGGPRQTLVWIHQLFITFSLLGCLCCETSCNDSHLHSVDLWVMEVFVVVRRKPTAPVHSLNQLLSSLMNSTDSSWTQTLAVFVQVSPEQTHWGHFSDWKAENLDLENVVFWLAADCSISPFIWNVNPSVMFDGPKRSQTYSSHGAPSRFLDPCNCDVNLYSTNKDCRLKIALTFPNLLIPRAAFR